MKIRLLIGAADPGSLDLYRTLLRSALDLLPLDIEVDDVTTRAGLTARVAGEQADVVLLDWSVAGSDTPAYLRQLVSIDPRLRTIVVMPLQLRQYRTCVWDAGACVGLAQEHLDQEWLLSMLCLITRAMQREERARHEGVV